MPQDKSGLETTPSSPGANPVGTSVIEKKMQAARSKVSPPAQSNAPTQRMDSLLKFQFEQDFSVYPDASLQDRLFAYAIDISVSGPLSLLVVSVFEFVVTRFLNLPHLASMLGVAVLSLIVPFLYWILMTWKVGMTVGKRIIGIQVVPRNFPNARLGPFSVFFRETLGRSLLFPLFPLALFGFFATDFVAGTRVVRVRNPDAEV